MSERPNDENLHYACHEKSHQKRGCLKRIRYSVAEWFVNRWGAIQGQRLVPPVYRHHPKAKGSGDIYKILSTECMEQLYDDNVQAKFGTTDFLSFSRLHHLNLHYFEFQLAKELTNVVSSQNGASESDILRVRELLRGYSACFFVILLQTFALLLTCNFPPRHRSERLQHGSRKLQTTPPRKPHSLPQAFPPISIPAARLINQRALFLGQRIHAAVLRQRTRDRALGSHPRRRLRRHSASGSHADHDSQPRARAEPGHDERGRGDRGGRFGCESHCDVARCVGRDGGVCGCVGRFYWDEFLWLLISF